MTGDLAFILSADEECRAHAAFAREQADRAADQARREREHAIEEQQRAAAAALEHELAAIRAEGDAHIAERRVALDDYLRRLDEAGEQRLESAARVYARIVRGETEGMDR